MARARTLGALLLLLSCSYFAAVAQADLPLCAYPGIFAFGDSLSDTGNGIAAFPEQFANAELDPNGQEFPMHAADRYTDGKLLLDFLGMCNYYIFRYYVQRANIADSSSKAIWHGLPHC